MKRFAPACDRNRDPILAVLRENLTQPVRVLEIASGTGQHAVYFSQHLPHVEWQPSDQDSEALASIHAYVEEAGLGNLHKPVELNVSKMPWPVENIGAVVCCNMIHISPWASTLGLMAGVGDLLPSGGRLMLYGPFIREGIETASSNLAFDGWLKQRDPRFGIRALTDVSAVAAEHGLRLSGCERLPANNCLVVFIKD